MFLMFFIILISGACFLMFFIFIKSISPCSRMLIVFGKEEQSMRDILCAITEFGHCFSKGAANANGPF
jgi:hypothetical protein